VKATVSSIEQAFTSSGAEYKKLKVIDENGKETTKTVFDNLQDKWSLLIEGAYLEFKMEKRGQFWNVVDISTAETTEAPAPEEGQPSTTPESKPNYAPQEIGMWMKELGECIRSGQLEKDYPSAHTKIKGYYYKKMSEVTGIPFK